MKTRAVNRGGISTGEGEPFAPSPRPPPGPISLRGTPHWPLVKKGRAVGRPNFASLLNANECSVSKEGGGVPGSLWGQTRTNVNRGAGSQQLLSHTVCPDQTLKIPQRLGVGNGTLGDTSAV